MGLISDTLLDEYSPETLPSWPPSIVSPTFPSTPILCLSGHFPFLPVFDPADLSTKLFRLSTPWKNRRIVSVVDPQDSSRTLVAVGQDESPHHVEIYDVNAKERVSKCSCHAGPIPGLAGVVIPPSSSRVISGGEGDSKIVASDSLSGEVLGSLPDPPFSTFRILSVPEWTPAEVFVGGWGRFARAVRHLYRYDLTKVRKIGQLRAHSRTVFGLAANVSMNVLYSASQDQTVKMWSRDFQDGVFPETTLKLQSRAYSLYSAEDKNLLLVGLEKGVEVWDVRQTRAEVNAIRLSSRACAYIHDLDRVDENHFVSASADGTVALWNPMEVGGGDQIRKTQRLGGRVCGIRVLDRPSVVSSVSRPTPRRTVSISPPAATIEQRVSKSPSVPEILIVHDVMDEDSNLVGESEISMQEEVSEEEEREEEGEGEEVGEWGEKEEEEEGEKWEGGEAEVFLDSDSNVVIPSDGSEQLKLPLGPRRPTDDAHLLQDMKQAIREGCKRYGKDLSTMSAGSAEKGRLKLFNRWIRSRQPRPSSAEEDRLQGLFSQVFEKMWKGAHQLDQAVGEAEEVIHGPASDPVIPSDSLPHLEQVSRAVRGPAPPLDGRRRTSKAQVLRNMKRTIRKGCRRYGKVLSTMSAGTAEKGKVRLFDRWIRSRSPRPASAEEDRLREIFYQVFEKMWKRARTEAM